MNIKLVSHNGETRSIKEWATILSVPASTLRRKLIKHGVSYLGNCDYKPTRNILIMNPLTLEKLTANQWAKKLNISPQTFYTRYKKWGLSPKTFSQIKLKNTQLKTLRPDNPYLIMNPLTLEKLLPCEWAEYYKISISEFYKLKNSYKTDIELFNKLTSMVL